MLIKLPKLPHKAAVLVNYGRYALYRAECPLVYGCEYVLVTTTKVYKEENSGRIRFAHSPIDSKWKQVLFYLDKDGDVIDLNGAVPEWTALESVRLIVEPQDDDWLLGVATNF